MSNSTTIGSIIKKLMTSEAYSKKIGSEPLQETKSDQVQSQVKIKDVSSVNIQGTQKVTIHYDHLVNVNPSENYGESIEQSLI